MNKQTAIDLIIEFCEHRLKTSVNSHGGAYRDLIDFCIEKGKPIEKEQILDAWLDGMRGEMIAPLSVNNYIDEAEDYYNENYKSENE